MYKVVTISKKTGIEEGYLGEYDTEKEAHEIADRFNLKADRHPSIAKVVQAEEDSENFFNDFFTNPRDNFDEEDTEESSEESSSEESSSEEMHDLSFDDKPKEYLYRKPIYKPSEEPIINTRPNFNTNQQEQKNINSFTQLQSNASSDRIRSRNKNEMQYNKDRFMFRDVGSKTSISRHEKGHEQSLLCFLKYNIQFGEL